MIGDNKFTGKPLKAKLVSQSHTAWPCHCQALKEQFEGEQSNSVEVLMSSTCKNGCGCAGNLLPLRQRALLSIRLLKSTPNNNAGLPGGQKHTARSIKKYSSPFFTAFTQLQLRGWQDGQCVALQLE